MGPESPLYPPRSGALGSPGLVLSVILGLVVTWAATPCSAAEFTRSFADITQGSSLLLIWEQIDPQYMPVTVYAQVLNRTGDNRANVFKRNLTVGINGTSWLWEYMPSPLPYLPTGLYQVEIKPETWVAPVVGASGTGNASAQQPVFPRSPYFVILDGGIVRSQTGAGNSSSSSDGSGGGGGGTDNRTTSMIVGLVVGFALLAIACAGICLGRRRYIRKREEARRHNKFDVVIH